jgi:hypothetical protein
MMEKPKFAGDSSMIRANKTLYSGWDRRCKMLMWSVSSKYLTRARRRPQPAATPPGGLSHTRAPARTRAILEPPIRSNQSAEDDKRASCSATR